MNKSADENEAVKRGRGWARRDDHQWSLFLVRRAIIFLSYRNPIPDFERQKFVASASPRAAGSAGFQEIPILLKGNLTRCRNFRASGTMLSSRCIPLSCVRCVGIPAPTPNLMPSGRLGFFIFPTFPESLRPKL